MCRFCNSYKCESATNDNRHSDEPWITDNFRYNHIDIESAFCVTCCYCCCCFLYLCFEYRYFFFFVVLSVVLFPFAKISLKSYKWKIVLTWIGFYVLQPSCRTHEKSLSSIWPQKYKTQSRNERTMKMIVRERRETHTHSVSILMLRFSCYRREGKSDFLPFLCQTSPTKHPFM